VSRSVLDVEINGEKQSEAGRPFYIPVHFRNGKFKRVTTRSRARKRDWMGLKKIKYFEILQLIDC